MNVLYFWFPQLMRANMKALRWLVVGCMLSVASAEEGEKAVAVVNGVSIGQQAFDQLLQQSLKQGCSGHAAAA